MKLTVIKLTTHLVSIACFIAGLTAGQYLTEAASPKEPSGHNSNFDIKDQNKKSFSFTFPRSKTVVFLVFRQSESSLARKWKHALEAASEGNSEIRTVASLGSLPSSFESTISARISRSTKESVLLDWDNIFPTPAARSLLVRVVSPCGGFTDLATGRDMKRDVATVVTQIQSVAKSRNCSYCRNKRF